MKAILGWLIFCAQKIGCKIRKNDWKGDKRAEWGKCSFQKSGFKIRILFLLKTIFINTHCENIKLDFGLVVQSLVPSHAPWNPFNYPVLNPDSHPHYTNLMQRPLTSVKSRHLGKQVRFLTILDIFNTNLNHV